MTRHRCYHWVNINVPEYKIHFQKRTWPLSGAAADARRGAVGRPAAGHLLLRQVGEPPNIGVVTETLLPPNTYYYLVVRTSRSL